jgi:hypothetical protein
MKTLSKMNNSTKIQVSSPERQPHTLKVAGSSPSLVSASVHQGNVSAHHRKHVKNHASASVHQVHQLWEPTNGASGISASGNVSAHQ